MEDKMTEIRELIEAYEEASKMLYQTNKKCYQTLCDKLDAKITLLTSERE